MEYIASDIKVQLDKLNSVLTVKGLVDQANKFVFDGEGIFAFNGEVFVATLFKNDLMGAVEGDIFYKIISKYGANKVNVEVKNDTLTITKGKAQSDISFDEAADCPLDLSIEKWRKLPEDFMEGIMTASFTTGNDFTDMRTVCVHVKEDICESSDVYRVTIFKMKKAIKDELFIPKDVVKVFAKSKPIKYSVQENWIYYEDSEGTIIAHRRVSFDKAYPNLTEKIESIKDLHKIVLPEKIYESLDLAKMHVDNKENNEKTISIECENGKLKISAENIGRKYKDEFTVDFDKKLKFDINPEFLMQLMEKSNEVRVSDSVIRIDIDNCIHVAALS